MKIDKKFFKKYKEKTIKFLKHFFIDVVLERILYDLDLIRFHPTKKLRLDAVTKAYQIKNFKLVLRTKLPFFRRIKLGLKENPQVSLVLLLSALFPGFLPLTIPFFVGAISYGNVTSDNVAANGTTLSYSHTAASGSGVVAITGVVDRDFYAQNPTASVTYAGAGMTKEVEEESADNTYSALFSKGSPTSGSQTVAVTWSSQCDQRSSGTMTFTGANTSNPVGATQSASGSGGTVTLSITTTVANSMIVDCLGARNETTAWPTESGQTERWEEVPTSNCLGAGSTRPATSTGAYSMTWASVESYWALTAVEVLEAPVTAPTVTTQAVTNIAQETATGNGNITDDGGDAGATRGMCWSTSPNPTTADNIATNGTGEGAYTVAMTSLVAGTHYYVRAYSINSAGTSYGSQVEFDTLSAGDGNFFNLF